MTDLGFLQAVMLFWHDQSTQSNLAHKQPSEALITEVFKVIALQWSHTDLSVQDVDVLIGGSMSEYLNIYIAGAMNIFS